jgi:hypothetical protein
MPGPPDQTAPMGVSDLVSRLRHPDGEVRAAAAATLKRIGAAQAERVQHGPLLTSLKGLILGLMGALIILVVILGALACVLKLLSGR